MFAVERNFWRVHINWEIRIMKKLHVRAVTNVRLLVIIGVAILVTMLITVTALMKNRGPQKETGRAPVSAPVSLKNTVGTRSALFVSPQDPKTPLPDVVHMVGPVSQDRDLRDLPYIPATPQEEGEVRLLRHPLNPNAPPGVSDLLRTPKTPSQSPNMPSPTQTFAGMTQNLTCGSCLPPDTDGDVGPNHYMQSVNSSIRVHDKSGNVLAGPVTYNSFFSALCTSTPCCSNQNQGDGVAFYDHIADRWIVSDFAFPAFPGAGPFYQCVGVSKTSNPVSGGY